VFDHMGRMPQPQGNRHPAFDILRRFLDTGRAWVKLSGPYLDTQLGAPRYADIKPVAHALAEHAPERCIWGSDWPHPTEPNVKPDDAVLFDLLQEWSVNETVRHRILVENPAALYGF
jgi:D-galactarolactone isomerase